MRTAYAKSGTRSRHGSNYTWGKQSRKARKSCERKARTVCEQHFSISLNRLISCKGAFEVRHSFLYFVGTHFRSFVRVFLVHLRTVYASPQKLARPQTPTREPSVLLKMSWVWSFSLPRLEWSMSNFPHSLRRNITSHSMKNVAYSDERRLYYQFSLLSLIHFS